MLGRVGRGRLVSGMGGGGIDGYGEHVIELGGYRGERGYVGFAFRL